MTHTATRSAEPASGWIPGIVYAFGDDLAQAGDFAALCGAATAEVAAHVFPDGETRVTARPHPGAEGATAVLYRALDRPNAKLVDTLLAAAAIRGLRARRVILIAPYMPYMRQDRAFHDGEAVSQKVIGALLGRAFDGVVTVQPHLHRTHDINDVFGGTPALALSAAPAFAADLKRGARPDTVIVGPDEESEPLIREVVAETGFTWFVAAKERRGDRDVRFVLPDGLDIRGRPTVIVDDIVSSGGTVATLARTLTDAGAGPVTVYAAHALFDADGAALMRSAGVARVTSLDGVRHSTNGIAAAHLIAKGIGAKH